MIQLTKYETLNRIVESGLVAVIRANRSSHALKIVEACAKGGVECIEVAFTVPRADQAIEELSAAFRNEEMLIGAGTVLDAETARIAILAGARFVVSPSLDRETARLCNRYQIPYLPGAGTAAEVIAALECGADIVKVFPGETLGPPFIKSMRGPLPRVALMPTGGVSVDNVGEWIEAGAVALGVGSNLTGGADRGNFTSITRLAKRFLQRIREARSEGK